MILEAALAAAPIVPVVTRVAPAAAPSLAHALAAGGGIAAPTR